MNATIDIRHITLRVHDLARSLAFYHAQLGFALVRQESGAADLAVSPGASPLLSLREDIVAKPAPTRDAGLFHAALLFPNRGALGAWLRQAAERGVEFDGFSDHAVSEALYFSDPDGNGLEFYADRPVRAWPIVNDRVEMVTRPLDIRSLLDAAEPGASLSGCRWGHLHLRVTNLDASEAFYTGRLGLDVRQRSFPGARFLAADGYHHHIGLNTWGSPASPQSEHALGLREAMIARRGMDQPVTLCDPDNIALRLVPL